MEVTLLQVLDARERRCALQRQLGAQYSLPLISFSMNIPGPVKHAAVIHNAFWEGCTQLEAALSSAGLRAVYALHREEVTGCEAFYVVDGPAERIKAVTADLEDNLPMGRLYDMDVLLPDGTKLDRELVSGGPRCCIVCGAPGKGCASRRVHSVAQLQEATRSILAQGLDGLRRKRIAALAVQSLLDEVCITPKPGLVDRAGSGSHKDMDIFTFMSSAAALEPYFTQCAAIGQRTRDQEPAQVFQALRTAGKQADRDMLQATGGVNTHKGAVYTMGILCCAAGRLWTPETERPEPEHLLDCCGEIAGPAAQADFEAMAAVSNPTAGQKLYIEHGIRGIRGQMADGLPALRNPGLPVLSRELAAGKSLNDAGTVTLLHLMACVTDTNMIARSCLDKAGRVQSQIRQLLEQDPSPSLDQIRTLDEMLIRENLSPGGCADLLAAALFVHFLCQESHRRKNQ